MRRRRVLAALACASVAGCLGRSGGTTTDDPTTNPAEQGGTDTTTDDGQTITTGEETTTSEETTDGTVPPPGSRFPRHVAVESVDDAALRETFGVAADVTVPDAEVTAGDTARVDVALETTDDTSQSLTYEQQQCSRNEFRATSDGAGLYLFPADGDWTRDDSDCPVVSYPNLHCGIPVVEETVTVPADEPLTWHYDAVVPPSNEGCVVPGRYAFERAFTADRKSATLSFDLTVTKA